ncbi:hypothetical protein K439DRAFT_1615270 [Ramaria rubella]|nr:hypothetical protein K439DRAFT_1615270 [Ramaria rubella]
MTAVNWVKGDMVTLEDVVTLMDAVSESLFYSSVPEGMVIRRIVETRMTVVNSERGGTVTLGDMVTPVDAAILMPGDTATPTIVVNVIQLGKRKHGDSHDRRSIELGKRRHGDSRSRGDSRGRRELDARRHGDSGGRGDSHDRRELGKRRHGDSRGRGDSHDRRAILPADFKFEEATSGPLSALV